MTIHPARRVLIIANGDWPPVPRLASLSAAAEFVVAVDGGWTRARRAGIRVDAVIGDFDSLAADPRPTGAGDQIDIVAYPPEKDWTDLELALDYALSTPAESVSIVGGIGDRLDHSLAAVFLLERGTQRGIPIVLVGVRETLRLLGVGTTAVSAEPGDRISLLPLTETAVVRTNGLRYPLRGERLYRAASRGVSNEVVSVPVEMEISSGLVLVVHASADPGPEGRSG